MPEKTLVRLRLPDVIRLEIYERQKEIEAIPKASIRCLSVALHSRVIFGRFWF